VKTQEWLKQYNKSSLFIYYIAESITYDIEDNDVLVELANDYLVFYDVYNMMVVGSTTLLLKIELSRQKLEKALNDIGFEFG